MSKISATIVADSMNPQGDRLTTMLVTFPRFILAELNTHRMLSKNSASSRAIPFKKMVESVQNNPFIPLAWQKEHKGMQGLEYFTDKNEILSLNDIWLMGRDAAVSRAEALTNLKATKQLANRLLEPFMYHTVLISGTEWENFFSLRCPQYTERDENGNKGNVYRSKKDYKRAWGYVVDHHTDLDWLKKNEGMAEIHMMALAEAMWDTMNESKPKQLQPGEWHIPFEDKIILPPTIPINVGLTLDEGVAIRKVKISTAMAARTSYTVVGDEKEFTTEQQIGLHDRMANQVPFHASPFEHAARCMTNIEYLTNIKGVVIGEKLDLNNSIAYLKTDIDDSNTGWCRNYRGFIQYREILEHDKNQI